ncbi:MAG: hypothetical protein NZM05_12480 [Chloroherpetonaceae bacterium]|nr:hypothetical protein [Chloroherpetonaceae bacterium]
MNPEELQRELIEKLNALSQSQNRLLYNIDYDEGQVIAAAKKPLGKMPFRSCYAGQVSVLFTPILRRR